MSDADQLTTFDATCLQVVAGQGPETSEVAIRIGLDVRLCSRVSCERVYAALARLERGGFATWRVVEATAEEGGGTRRVWDVTEAGMCALADRGLRTRSQHSTAEQRSVRAEIHSSTG